jgi:DNA-directed RNA polymerase subunit H (RpoH/RPB5)
MEILYEKYVNIQKFILTYRKYKVDNKFLDFPTFKKTIQTDQYIKHKCFDVTKGRVVFIYLFKCDSIYLKTTPQFKRLMDKLPEEPYDVIIITKVCLSIYINKALLKYTHLKIFNYLHKYFCIELAKGPMCSEHIILSNNEVRSLCARELIIHPLSLPSISINDPQNIWIGGEIGQVIKIKSISEITGKTIRYKIVSPGTGKMVNIQKLRHHIQEHENEQDLKDQEEMKKNIPDDVDETIAEYGDDIESDNDEYSD